MRNGTLERATLRLFKALPITSKKVGKTNEVLLKETIKRGFVFSSEVVGNYKGEVELKGLINTVEKEIGLTSEKMNASFHKSWKKVKEAPLIQLYFEQILHYITTYGFEALGIYDGDSVYIPVEELEIPELKGNLRLIIIKGYTKDELKEKVLELLKSGIALKEETIKDVVEVLKYTNFKHTEIDNIKNKEVRVTLYTLLSIFPEHPIEFLRYVVYRITDKTLLIKNKTTIETIKNNLYTKDRDLKNYVIASLFTEYEQSYGLEKLAEIFYRFKPLFLAMKCGATVNTKINKIRKLAVKNHKPMQEDYLNTVTSKIKRGERISRKELKKKLEEVNVFRKIRLAYALNFRLNNNPDSIVYRVRNGKGWATNFYCELNKKKEISSILETVTKSIVNDIEKNVKGKKIYIPKEMIYTLPATEKQFTGDIPTGSYVKISKDMIVGVHWENIKSERIDLDLSMISEAEKIGWDSSYRNDDRTILFSGDVTDASLPNGATELFYVQRQVKDVNLLCINNYTYRYNWDGDDDEEVPFQIIIGKTQLKSISKNHMVDPNEVIVTVNSTIGEKQKMLGMLVTTTKGCKFYFVENYVGGSISSRNSKVTKNSRKYLFNYYTNTLSLNDILLKAGATLVEVKDQCDIDLSPESLERDSIIKLLN